MMPKKAPCGLLSNRIDCRLLYDLLSCDIFHLFMNCDKFYLFSALLMTEMMMISLSSENVFVYWPIKLVSYLSTVKNCMRSTREWKLLTSSFGKNWRRK